MATTSVFTVERYHDFCFAHRVRDIDPKCGRIHGHNARATFYVTPTEMSSFVSGDATVVLEFGDIKRLLCDWLEDNWDHRMLVAYDDPDLERLRAIDPSIVELPFQPSTEMLAGYLLNIVGPQQLAGLACELVKVRFEETRKCAVIVERK